MCKLNKMIKGKSRSVQGALPRYCLTEMIPLLGPRETVYRWIETQSSPAVYHQNEITKKNILFRAVAWVDCVFMVYGWEMQVWWLKHFWITAIFLNTLNLYFWNVSMLEYFMRSSSSNWSRNKNMSHNILSLHEIFCSTLNKRSLLPYL